MGTMPEADAKLIAVVERHIDTKLSADPTTTKTVYAKLRTEHVLTPLIDGPLGKLIVANILHRLNKMSDAEKSTVLA